MNKTSFFFQTLAKIRVAQGKSLKIAQLKKFWTKSKTVLLKVRAAQGRVVQGPSVQNILCEL